MTEPLSDKQVDRLIASYLAGSLSETDKHVFEAWLRASPEHPRRVARLSMTDFCIREVCQDTKSDYLLDVLNQIDQASGPAQLVTLHNLNRSPWHRYRIHAVWGAIAAALLLGVVLAAVLLTGSDTPAPMTNTNTPPTELGRVGPDTTTPVATLTATHNAQWAERALARGAELHPNTRLTLTAGFAEITTNHGAVAILEAPATIELLDNNNALRLHTGKLVGICETESSKGLLVRTAHMDITDLGTRFGVDLTRDGFTEVHVLEGEVKVRPSMPTQDSPAPVHLRVGQAVAASPAAGLADVAYDRHRFVPDMATAAIKPDFAGTNAVWLGQVSGDLRQGKRKADALQVFLEQRDLSLDRKVLVDFNPEHPWDPATADKQYDVPFGERVDVYLLHFDLLSGHQQAEDFELDFDRPILGVIISQRTLNATDEALGAAGVTYPIFRMDLDFLMGGQRGLNYRADGSKEELALIARTNDLATISPDGTQLNLRLWGGDNPSRAKMDQVRVLVRSQRTYTTGRKTDSAGVLAE